MPPLGVHRSVILPLPGMIETGCCVYASKRSDLEGAQNIIALIIKVAEGKSLCAEIDSSRVDEEMEWLTEAFTCCETKARPGRTSIVVEAQRATPPARVGVGIAFDSEG